MFAGIHVSSYSAFGTGVEAIPWVPDAAIAALGLHLYGYTGLPYLMQSK